MSITVAEVLARTWRENRLFAALIELTYRCNLDCFFCYNDLGLRGSALDAGQYRTLLEDLAALGVLNLTLSGGEPLAHPDFFTIGADARALGFVVRVKSNGHALRGAIARRLRDEVDPFLVEVSLHGATAATHDRQTRVDGSFVRLLENLDELARLGLRIKLNSTLTRWNEDEVEAMFALADARDLPLQVDPEVTVRDDGDRDPLAIQASEAGLRRLFTLQRDRGQADQREHADGGGVIGAMAPPPPAGKHCGAGSSGIAVDPFGNVYPCVQWRRSVGNLHEASIREIWASSLELAAVRREAVAVRQAVAAVGADAGLMSFCPGTASTLTGKPTEIYPQARTRMRVAAEVRDEAPRSLLPVIA